MSRTRCATLLLFIFALTAGLRWTQAAEEGPERRPPNIVLLYTDDQRFDSIHALGNPVIETPALDRLVAEGTVFRNSFVTTAICCTSRASLFTGQYARRHGIHDFSTPLVPEALAETFPLQLRAAGYRTGFVGKWGVGNVMPEESYDYWRGFPGQGKFFDDDRPGLHLTDRQGEQALEFLDGCTAEQPFCLQVSFKAPHTEDPAQRQMPPSARYESLYEDSEMPIVPTANEESFARLPKFLQDSEARIRWAKLFDTPEKYQASVRDYFRLITGVDDVVGQVRARLAERGLAENTVIIFTADNGYCLGEHGLSGKWFMYEESIRVPLVIFDPRHAANERVAERDEMALNIDIAPTILELAGVPVPASMQGASLAPLVEGRRDVAWRDRWFYEHLFEHKGLPKSEGVRTERWKYVRFLLPDGRYEQLFDLRMDPREEQDLARDAKHAGRLEELRTACDTMLQRAE
ncbi:MAG: sulfatase [Pirellulales bacterium]|nr:sulfatase [Pirellulales bacterium]